MIYLLMFWRRVLSMGIQTLCGLAVLLASPVLQARENIDLAWALQQTLANNEELATYPLKQARAEALRLQAGLRPTPTLELTVENAFGSGEYSSLDSAETTLTLSQTIELGDKRQQRVQLANASILRQESEYELARLDVLAETSRRYYRLLAIQQRQHVNAQRINDEQQALATIRSRARAGAIGQADVAKMDLRLARSLATQQQLVEENSIAKLRLAAMWQAEADFQHALGNINKLPRLPVSATVVGAIEETPAFLNQLALQRLMDAQLQLATANGSTDLNLGIGVRNLEASNDQAVVMSFSMPLAFKNPNRGRIKAARANIDLSQASIDTSRRRLTLALLEIQQRINGYQRRAEFLQSQVLPKAEILLSDTERGYQQGRYSVLQWTDAQGELFSLQRELIEIHSQVFLQLLELERITGQAMTDVGPGELL